jgi:hypothetical protein
MLVVTVLVAAHAGVAPVLAGDASDDAADTDATAEAASTPPCSSPEFRQFDFWLGEWELAWEGGGGTNVITAILDDCVIQESFAGDMADGSVFRGLSVSTYNLRAKQWQQTWVDNQGAYLDFAGGFEDGRMILSRQAERDGKAFLQRMVWRDIEQNSLEWDWQRSDDGGETWQVLWHISYTRKQEQ